MKRVFTSNLFSFYILLCTAEKTVLLGVDEIFDTLKNGEWHDFEEISEKTQLSVFKLELLTKFLAEYKFIELDKRKQRTRLTPPLLNFIKKIQNDDI